MNAKLIVTTLGTIVAKVAKIGATQSAVQNLQNTNRKDINAFNDGDFKMELVTKENLQNFLPEKKDIKLKEGVKTIGLGTAKMLKIGAQTQVIYSLNERNRNEMKELDGQMTRAYKYNVSPKLEGIKKIKVGRD